MLLVDRQVLAAVCLITTCFFSNSMSIAATFGSQSSQRNVEWDFDFVEEFDGLQDWVRTEGRVGNRHDVDYPDNMPKLLNGEQGPWGYYSVWVDDQPSQNWIGAYNDNRVWRGTKSLTIDLGGAKGPSRFGIYMGEGYTDVWYVFFMVNIPKNVFPTNCASTNNGCNYIAGNPYTWYSYWKFTTFNMNCPSSKCPWNTAYSDDFVFVGGIRNYNYGDFPGQTLDISGAMVDKQWANDGTTSLDPLLGSWMGVEYKITQTQTETYVDTWVYDINGMAYKVMNNQLFPTPPEGHDGTWNHFFFGGNKSFDVGSNMSTSYNIDDVIIDDQRIGPKYFQLIKGGVSEIMPPTNVRVIVNN